MKYFSTILVTVALVAFLGGLPLTASVTAADGPEKTKAVADSTAKAKAAEDTTAKAKEKVVVEGSDAKGKYYYKKTCKSCHGPKGEGGDVTPISKTTKQWERYFKKGIHITSTDKDGNKVKEMLLKVKDIDEVKLIHIETFLINHAADSDQPETCG